jgi:hypothetical protein
MDPRQPQLPTASLIGAGIGCNARSTNSRQRLLQWLFASTVIIGAAGCGAGTAPANGHVSAEQYRSASAESPAAIADINRWARNNPSAIKAWTAYAAHVSPRRK